MTPPESGVHPPRPVRARESEAAQAPKPEQFPDATECVEQSHHGEDGSRFEAEAVNLAANRAIWSRKPLERLNPNNCSKRLYETTA
jgi:hypothetical protein